MAIKIHNELDISKEIINLKGLFKYLVLYSISILGKAHGYEIKKELSKLFNLNYIPSNGILYPTLHELEKEGLLKSHTNGRKKIYELTEKGLMVFHENEYNIRRTIEKINILIDVFNEIGIYRLISVIKDLWIKDIDVPHSIIHQIKVKVDEIIDLLQKIERS
uniref:PadR family transcriptional regulator n=1 Tax=Ignisphaera aggregans TaxID=334771 RepID=A0A7J3QCW2_9CREN